MAASDPTEIPSGAPEERVDALYGLPLEEFTPQRDALAKELRQAGRREEANWVKALRRPSAAAWVVNQLARSQPGDARRLLEADERLREANARVLEGKASAGELSGASEEHSAAIRELMGRAPGLLDNQGRSPSAATLDRAQQTLRALVLDDEARRRFELARLTSEEAASGFGSFEGQPAKAAPKRERAAPERERAAPERERAAPEPEPPPARPRRSEQRARAREALKQARAEQRERRRAVTAAERELASARREAERAQRAAEEAAETLAKAQAAEAAARERVEDVQAELEGGA